MTLPPFQALLDAHGAVVHRFLVASVGPSDADDCFQEACIAALRAYPRLTHADNLRAWLLRIAQRKAIDAHRARGRRPSPIEDIEPGAQAAPGSDGEPALWAQVRALPTKQRAAIVLRFVGNLRHAEIARALGCSEEAARRSLHEGLRKLREEWMP